MKISMILLAFFGMNISAFAMPTVGDQALFAVTDTTNGQNYTGTVEIKLVSFDAAAKQWDEQELITVGGQTNTRQQTLTTDQLLTDASVQGILNNCTAYNGTLQTITVPAGTFGTCALPDNGNGQTGTVWVSNVTFGIVQSDTTNSSNGEHTVLKLISSSAGN
jgi:hypothetical protein